MPEPDITNQSQNVAPKESLNQKLRKWLEQIEPWQKSIATLAAIIAIVYSLQTWIHSSAQKAVLDERFLTTLAARIRPVYLFDSRGTIEADLGAGDYIDQIQIRPTPKNYGFEIIITPKRHLIYAPLVSAVDVDLFAHTSQRGNKHDWIISMTPQSTVSHLLLDNQFDTNAVYHFKLEILH